MRYPPRENLRRVGPVDTDEPAARPIREDARARVGPEGDGAIHRAAKGRHPNANVKAAARSWPPRLADADRGAEDDPAFAEKRRRQPVPVDHEPRVNEDVATER